MINGIKKRFGLIKRGAIGFFIDRLEKIKTPGEKIKKYGVGMTVGGEKIIAYEIGRGEKNILFLSAIHGNEVGTVKLAFKLIDWLDKENIELKEKLKFFIIPCLNVDGYKTAKKNPNYFNDGRAGRFNSNNVDLNRNFPTPSFKNESIYSFGENYSEKEIVYCGPHGNSESETKSLIKFIEDNNIKLIISFHNKGKDVTGNNLADSKKLSKIYSEKSGFKCVNNKEWEQLNQGGTLKEWTELKNIIYLEPEAPTRWGSGWRRQKQAIIAILKNFKDY